METQTDTYEDEINILDYVKVVLRHKLLVCGTIVVLVVLTAVASLLMTPIYESKAIITPVQKAGDVSGASVLAAQFGIGAPSSGSMSEIVNLLKSTILKERIINRHKLIPVFFKANDLNGKSEAEKLWAGIRYMDDALSVKPNVKDNSIELSVQCRDPKMAADLANYVLTELTDYMSAEARRVADINRQYLESQIDKTADPFIKTKLYTLIAQQIETAMMAEVKENFAFKVLDPPKVPDRKVKPKRTQMVIISFVVSIFIGILLAFAVEFWRNHKEEFKSQT